MFDLTQKAATEVHAVHTDKHLVNILKKGPMVAMELVGAGELTPNFGPVQQIMYSEHGDGQTSS